MVTQVRKSAQAIAREATEGTQFRADVVGQERTSVWAGENYRNQRWHPLEVFTFRVVREAVGHPLIGSWEMEVKVLIREGDKSSVLEDRATNAIRRAMRAMDDVTLWGSEDFSTETRSGVARLSPDGRDDGSNPEGRY